MAGSGLSSAWQVTSANSITNRGGACTGCHSLAQGPRNDFVRVFDASSEEQRDIISCLWFTVAKAGRGT
jgi:hypothetical protein